MFCEDLIGKPFSYRGQGPNSFDCYGLVRELLKREGKSVPKFVDVLNQNMAHDTIDSELTKSDWVKVDKKVGAIAVIRIGRRISHVGYVLGKNEIIHCWAQTGGVTRERLDHWERRIVGYYEYAG